MRPFVSMVCLAAVLGGCATPGERTAIGAGGGALIGAGIGGAAGGWEGAAIGALRKYPDDRIRIQGHTDSIGSAAHNEKLSLERAGAVRDVLVSRGVDPRQILVEGAGSSRPIADNATAEGRAENRRVELHIDVPQRS
jgi:OmpA family